MDQKKWIIVGVVVIVVVVAMLAFTGHLHLPTGTPTSPFSNTTGQ
jgi:hypothetical protein